MFELYKILNIKRNATTDEIRKAFRKLAKETHPDLNANDPEKIETFRKIKAAYDVLSDKEKRAEYDDSQEKLANPPPPSKSVHDYNDIRYQVLDWIDRKARIKRWCHYRFFVCSILFVLLFVLFNIKGMYGFQKLLYTVKISNPLWVVFGFCILIFYQVIRLIIDGIRILYYRYKIKKNVKTGYYQR